MENETDAEHRFRLLVVEDEPDCVRLLKAQLSYLFDIEAAGEVASGLARLERAPAVHALLLDLMLPNGDGLEVVRRFRAARPKLPIVVLSALSFTPQVVVKAGAQAYLQKAQYDQPALVATIQQVLLEALAEQEANGHFQEAEEGLRSLKATVAGTAVAQR